MDIKSWFEEGTNLSIKELRYLNVPPLPFNLFIDDQNFRGADKLNNIIEHNISIEHYSETITKDEELNEEKIIENFLNKEGIEYSKEREWLSSEKMWVTVYSFIILEKVRKEDENE